MGITDFKSCFSRLVKLNHAFERIGYANDPYLGTLTVSPKHLGTGMSITANYKLYTEKGGRTIGIEEAEQIGREHNCSLWVQEDRISIETTRTLAPNYNEVL